MALLSFLDKEFVLFVIKLAVPSFVCYLFVVAVYHRFFHPLRHFPGPFWASITPLWYVRALYMGRGQDIQRPIHDKYGTFVRIAPNLLSIADPAAAETVYEPHNGKVFRKGVFYEGFDPKISKRKDIFCDRDEVLHAERRRIVAHLYTQGSVLSYEPCIDRLIEIFYRRMEKVCSTGEIVDMSVWLKRYTFDVIGEIFYGRAGGFGMIRDSIDYNNWCLLLETIPIFGSTVTYIPWGFQTLWMAGQMFNKQARIGMRGFFDVVKQAHVATQERLDAMSNGDEYNKEDVLSRLIQIVNEKGDKVGFEIKDVTTELWMVIWAGSDTTAVGLTSIFYHLHKHPETKKKLLEEIDEAFESGSLTYPVSYRDASKLPYLRAVVLEGLRVHPSLGSGLPRVVPPEGAEIAGTYVPGGGWGNPTEVIMNAPVVHFDKKTFGEDADDFIPERWIRDGDKVAQEMERAMLSFGRGPRVCIGKHITWTEMYKLLPTILRDFEFDMLCNEWSVFAGWFHNQKGVDVKVSRRRPQTERPTLVREGYMKEEAVALTA